MTNEFLNLNKELKEIIRLGKFLSLKIEKFEGYVKWTNKYFDYLENYARNQDKLFIFEGTHLFKCINVSHFIDKPFIVVGTNYLCSCIRRLRRHYKIDKSENRKSNYFKKHIWKLLNDFKRLHIQDFKCLNKFLKLYKSIL